MVTTINFLYLELKITLSHTVLSFIQELIQNADDAQATKVAFLIDWRHHPIDDVMFPNFEKYQGPALYAWNNAVFEKKDWYSLAKISDSSKKDDVSKSGRFGLGFQSVFHITGMIGLDYSMI